MRDVFPALERRFSQNKRLVGLARKLYHGHGGEIIKSVRAHVEVTCTGISHEYDSFSTDEPLYSLEFSINTRGREATQAADIMAEIINTFDDADVTSDAFDTVSMRLTGASGPYLEDGTYRARMAFDLHVCLKTKVPVERMGVN